MFWTAEFVPKIKCNSLRTTTKNRKDEEQTLCYGPDMLEGFFGCLSLNWYKNNV